MSEATCATCRMQIETTKSGHMIPHQRATGWTNGAPFSFEPCRGSRKASLELRGERAAKRVAKKRAEIESARHLAAVALDAVLVGRDDMRSQLQYLLDLALREYRLDNPKSRVDDIHRNVSRRHESYVRTPRVDVYCTFCGELLAQDWKRGWDSLGFSDQIDRHCVPCALQHLAGMRKAVSPDIRKLPDDAVDVAGSEAQP